jgi:hypothetical protein
MRSGKGGAKKVLVLLAVMGFLWAVTPGLGGMAELGLKRTLALEAGSDPADGGGRVAIHVEGRPPFTHPTNPGDTVDLILQSLADQINLVGGLQATGPADTGGAPGEITILKLNGGEVSQLGIVNDDTGFGFVSASRKNTGPLRVGTVIEEPSGVRTDTDPAQVIIEVDGVVVFQEFTAGHTAASLNAAIESAMQGQRGVEVSWEDDDTGIKSIGAYAVPGKAIPTVSGWGIALLVLALTTTALILLRRRSLSRV